MQASDKHYPWVWLGFEEIYYKDNATDPWQPLNDKTSAGDVIPWGVEVNTAGGQMRLYRPGVRLGLSNEDAHLQELDCYILEALAKALVKKPILFAPPAQLAGLVETAKRFKCEIQAMVLDCVLFQTNAARDLGASVNQPDTYVFDWSHPAQRIIRGFSEILEPSGSLFYPVLMTAQDYTQGYNQILSYYTDDGITQAKAVFKSPAQLRQGCQAVSLGLVWAWGTGPLSWQWALRPLCLSEPAANHKNQTWGVELTPPDRYRISGIHQSYEGQLTPPVLTWGLNSGGRNA